MGKKVWAAFVAGGILVAAGLIAAMISSPEVASAQEGADDARPTGPRSRIVGLLDDILGDLVDDGTLSQDQADAIVDAAEQRAAELRAEHGADFDLLRSLWDDGVITEEEASQLPEDHFLFRDRFDDAWEDGELTIDELHGVLHQFRRGMFRRGFRLGSLLDDGGIDRAEYEALPDASPLKHMDLSEYLEDGLITRDELREIFTRPHADHTDVTTDNTSD